MEVSASQRTGLRTGSMLVPGQFVEFYDLQTGEMANEPEYMVHGGKELVGYHDPAIRHDEGRE